MFLTEIFIFVLIGLLVFMGLSFIVKNYIRRKERKEK
jgi:hypothetical protein